MNFRKMSLKHNDEVYDFYKQSFMPMCEDLTSCKVEVQATEDSEPILNLRDFRT